MKKQKDSGVMRIEMRPVKSIKPFAKNPRDNDHAVDAVAQSIKSFGFRNAIVVDSKGVIISGHTRWKAAQKLGMKEVPVHVANISPTKARAFRLADNRTAEISDWNLDLLSQEIQALSKIDFDLPVLGFKEMEIQNLLGDDPKKSEKENAVPKRAKSRVKKGDIWKLGDHLLACGDAKEEKIFKHLLGKKQADLVFTDPPYGVQYEGKTNEKLHIQNDDGVGDIESVVFPALTNTLQHTRSGGAWYMCCPSGPFHLHFCKWLTEAKVWRQTLIWVKDSLVLGRGDYHYQHESILFGWKEGAMHRAPKTRDQSSVWNIARPKSSKTHPTIKPLEIVEKALINSSEKGWIILDPFVGSGTTIIAAEKTGRKCFGIEVDSKYCDVILARFEEYSGKTPKRLSNIGG